MHLIEDSQRHNKILLNLLFANHTKWLNTLKHLSAVASVFGHFVGLVLQITLYMQNWLKIFKTVVSYGK